MVKKLNTANDSLSDAFGSALNDKIKAEQKLTDATRNLGALQYQLDLSQASKAAVTGEQQKQLEAALEENKQLQGRLRIVRAMTDDGDAGFWSAAPLPERRMQTMTHVWPEAFRSS